MFSISALSAEVKKKTVNKQQGIISPPTTTLMLTLSRSRITIKTAKPLKNKKGKKGKKNASAEEMAL